jgi:hypothetical protein
MEPLTVSRPRQISQGPQARPKEAPRTDGREAKPGADEYLKDLRDVALAADSLAEHLAECWPVRGQGPALAGPPTLVTVTNQDRYLAELGISLYRVTPPADPAACQEWWKKGAWRMTATMAEPLSKIMLLYDRLARQFGHDPVAPAADGVFRSFVIPSARTSRPWQPRDGRAIPEIDPHDLRALQWSAIRLFQSVQEKLTGGVQQTAPQGRPTRCAPANPEGPEKWMPASEATNKVAAAGHSLTLPNLSKLGQKGHVRTRPRTLPGNHQLEAEWNSLCGYLVGRASEKHKTEVPSEGELDEEIAKATKAKQRDYPLD